MHEHEQPLIFAAYAPVLLQFYYGTCRWSVGGGQSFFRGMREIIVQFAAL
ncbi:hypothetical protein AGRO_1181 [Agrobacterium sp. ATCC 31749]|nr:hypothetical protein AGRO_1181 [Agrobacterium sp. ATCC 31749]